jgi:hypothetical protein
MFKKLREAIKLYKLFTKGRDAFVKALRLADKPLGKSKTTVGSGIALLITFLATHILPLLHGGTIDLQAAIVQFSMLAAAWVAIIGGRDAVGRLLTTMKERE